MSSPPVLRFWSCALLAGTFSIRLTSGQTVESDPVGYIGTSVAAHSVTLVPVNLVNQFTLVERVVAVDQQGIQFASPIPVESLGEANAAFAEVREGAMPGLKLEIAAVAGDRLLLEWSPLGLIQPDDLITVRPSRLLGELLGSPPFYLETGSHAEEADTVGLWNPITQTSRIFYYKTGQGWREAGKENEGDRASTPVPFPSGLIIRRRAATGTQVVITGSVPVPYFGFHYYCVRPGRNVISAPLSNSRKLADFLGPWSDSGYGLASGPSAPESDTIRFYQSAGPGGAASSLSPVVYLRSDRTWRAAGTDEDASNLSLEFSQCLDLHRVGPAGLLRLSGITEPSPTPSPALEAGSAPSSESIPITLLARTPSGLRVHWIAEPETVYQLQSLPPGAPQWLNIGPPVTTSAHTASQEFTPTGQGILRIVPGKP